MADVRSLLRQQRTQRRIDHPCAAYSDAGKLLCTACREPVRAEALWDQHVRSVRHRQAVRGLQVGQETNGPEGEHAVTAAEQPSHKRKHDDHDDDDEEMGAGAVVEDGAALGNKRSRAEPSGPVDTQMPSLPIASAAKKVVPGKEGDKGTGQAHTPTLTPPLRRRMSVTPSQGVELQIASRPATPNTIHDGGGGSGSGTATSAASTPNMPPIGRSPLVPQEAAVAGSGAAAASSTLQAATAASKPGASTSATPAAASQPLLGEDEDWAAFEAEVVNAKPAAAAINGVLSDNDGAVISAAPVSAEELAARGEEDEQQRRRAMADIEIEDEREEATRALEAEFEEMEELEARVRKLKEKREALRNRRGSSAAPAAAGSVPAGSVASGTAAPGRSVKGANGKENVQDGEAGGGKEGEDEENDDDEDDWVGFRFRR